MSEKVLKTRIKMKNGTPQEWLLAQNFIPLQGEIIIYNDDVPKIKIGDGVTLVEELPFITDNYALKEELPANITCLNFEGILSANNWTTTKPYSQTITIEGISSYDNPEVFLDLSQATEDNVDSLELNWGKIKYSETNLNTLTFYCIKEAPIVDLPFFGRGIYGTANGGEEYISAIGVEF